MTDTASGGEHYATILAAVISIVSTFVLGRAGNEEGRRVAAAEAVPAETATAVGAAILDRETYKAVIDGMQGIFQRLDRVATNLDRLVELTEGNEEKALREGIRDDFRAEMREMAESFRRMTQKGSAS